MSNLITSGNPVPTRTGLFTYSCNGTATGYACLLPTCKSPGVPGTTTSTDIWGIPYVECITSSSGTTLTGATIPASGHFITNTATRHESVTTTISGALETSTVQLSQTNTGGRSVDGTSGLPGILLVAWIFVFAAWRR